MKKFKFSFESILHIRKKKEELIISELAEAQTEEHKILGEIEDRKLKISGALEYSKHNIAGAVNLGIISQTRSFIEAMKTQIARFNLRLKEIKDKILEIKMRLNKALVERKTMETLKDKKWEEYKKAYNKADNETMDEISNSKRQPEKKV